MDGFTLSGELHCEYIIIDFFNLILGAQNTIINHQSKE